MSRLLSLAAGTLLLALVVTSSVLPGSLASVPVQPTAHSIQDRRAAANRVTSSTTGVAPDTLLVELRPTLLSGESTFDQTSDAIAIPRMFAALGVRSAAPVFPRATNTSDAQMATSGIASLRRIYRLQLTPGADAAWVAATMRANPLVAFAEPDYQARIIAIPNDPRYAEQWALTKINAPAGWDVTTGSGAVVIAVIDSGVDTEHADLAGQLWTNPGEIAGNGIDDDNDGHIDDLNGWNFLGDNADISDATGHGTQVAGVLAAAANNSAGIAGICWGCKLMIVKVTQSGGVANYSDIAAGVLYAAQKGAKVINLSLGGTSDSATLRAAITVAAQTAVIVGGAGNNSSATPFYPAAYDDAVLAVAGTTQTDTKVVTSNYGAWVDVSAPGQDILTTFSGGGYGAASGTSVAAPFASGLAGLLLSQHPDWSPAQARAQIINTATSIDGLNPGLAGQIGSGRLNAGAALTTPAAPVLAITSYSVNGQPSARPEPGSAVDLLVTLANKGNSAANVRATLSASGILISQPSGSFGAIPTFKSGTNTVAFHFTAAAGYNTPMSFTLSVTADGGYAVAPPLIITTSPGITNVSATIRTQTWTADHVYMINQDSGLLATETLTIQPGTVVRFAPNTSLSIAGTLIADAPAAQPIRFTRQGTTGTWGQIKFLDSSIDASFDATDSYISGSILRGAIIEYGQGANLNNAGPFIAHNIFRAASVLGTPGASPALIIADNTFVGAGISIYSASNVAILRNTITNGPTLGAGGALSVSGAGSVVGNDVSAAVGMGMDVAGAFTIANNRVVNSGTDGLLILGGTVHNNLLAYNGRYGLMINTTTPVTVSNNTIVSNNAAEIYLASGAHILHNNNLLARAGGYALRLAAANVYATDATDNYWGSTDPLAIQELVYDGDKEFGLGIVNFSSPLSIPDQNAPAYVQHVAVGPDTTLGIQTGTFEVQFSRPMDQSAHPLVTFAQAKRGTWTPYTLPDIGLSNSSNPNHVIGMAVDRDGSRWFATTYGLASFDGTTWKTYSTMNPFPPSNMPIGGLSSIVIDGNGNKWVGSSNGLARFDGTSWTTYPFQSGTNVSSGAINSLAIDKDGSIWFTTGLSGGVGRFDGTTWRYYRSVDTGLAINATGMMTIDHNGVKWFSAYNLTSGGVGRFDGTTWARYTPANSGLPDTQATGFAIDTDGSAWFTSGSALARVDGNRWTIYRNPSSGSGLVGLAIDKHGVKWAISLMDGGIVSFDGTSWKSYPLAISDIMYTSTSMTIDDDGNKWVGLYSGNANAFVLWGGDEYPLTANVQWLDDHTWRANYDITSLVLRGAQAIRVSGARGEDGMAITPDSSFGFMVDYAGTISDRTPPSPPHIFATGTPGDPSSVHVIWSANDSESGIMAYRYAIGSAPGATDVVNWTNVQASGLAARVATSNAEAGITRAGLGLADGQQYWVSVQAQNSGGLWSASKYGSFIAGKQSFITLYLPLLRR